jgi:dUTP pyrophosphatase
MTDSKLTVQFTRDNYTVPIPKRGDNQAVGWDLTAIKIHSNPTTKTTLYDTGIKVLPPQGYYIEIVPRSSLVKTGYMLSNSVGIIDPNYRSNLLIALTKVDDTAPDLTVPFTKCQLVLRKFEEYTMSEVNSFEETGRGGFGSTDK